MSGPILQLQSGRPSLGLEQSQHRFLLAVTCGLVNAALRVNLTPRHRLE
jgi:hypothetical protein